MGNKVKKDLNKIARIEKAIREKYGEEAIKNPNGSWDETKEQKYLKDLKNFHNRPSRPRNTEEYPGFLLKNKKSKKIVDRNCPTCESYSFSSDDDMYMIKFGCCFNCYVEYIEDREERWKSGWRPNK